MTDKPDRHDDALLPCPLCDEENARFTEVEEKDERRYVEMRLECHCGIELSETLGWSLYSKMAASHIVSHLRSKLTKRWNTRAPSRDAAEGAVIGGTNFCGHGVMAAICPKCTPPKPAPDAMREAARQLVDRLDHVHAHPAYKAVWEISQIHGGLYLGPSYANDLSRLREALSAPVPSADGPERKVLKLLFTNEWLRDKIGSDPDLPCEVGPQPQPRFFIDHELIHDRLTGKHVVTNGEPPFEDSIEQVCELLNGLTLSPSPAVAVESVAQRMLEYARRLNDIAATCEIDGMKGHAADLRRIAQQIVATRPVGGRLGISETFHKMG